MVQHVGLWQSCQGASFFRKQSFAIEDNREALRRNGKLSVSVLARASSPIRRCAPRHPLRFLEDALQRWRATGDPMRAACADEMEAAVATLGRVRISASYRRRGADMKPGGRAQR